MPTIEAPKKEEEEPELPLGPWVPFDKRFLKKLPIPTSTSETFDFYLDQLRFMPDIASIIKVFWKHRIYLNDTALREINRLISTKVKIHKNKITLNLIQIRLKSSFFVSYILSNYEIFSANFNFHCYENL